MAMEPKKVNNKGNKEKKDKNSKKKSKKLFMMCFIPPADDYLPEKPHRRIAAGGSNAETISSGHKKVKKNNHHHSESLDGEFEKKKKEEEEEMPTVLDAVLLANSLESRQNSFQNNKIKISSYRKLLPFEEESRRSSSNSNTSSKCSGCSSSSSSSSRSNSFDGREAILSQGINYHGLCLVLIILLVLMLWGKLYAILCTTMWLYFVPTRRSLGRVTRSPVNHDQFVNMVGSVDYKRRVVLEGFLERNRPR